MYRRFLSHSSSRNLSCYNRTVGTFPRSLHKASHPSSTFYECQTLQAHGCTIFFLENCPQLTRDVDVWKVEKPLPKNSQASMSGWIKNTHKCVPCVKMEGFCGVLWLLNLHWRTGVDWILARFLSELSFTPCHTLHPYFCMGFPKNTSLVNTLHRNHDFQFCYELTSPSQR